MPRIFSTIVLCITASTGCIRLNQDHCGNQEGSATCQERGGETLYCSVCVSDNDGCVAVEPTPECGGGAGTGQTGSTLAGTDSEPSTGSGETAGTTGTTGTTVVDLTAGSSETGVEPDPCGNGAVDNGEDCDGDVGDVDCGMLGLGKGSITCSSTCLFETRDCSNPPVCGNEVLEPGEQCDTIGTTCDDFDPDRYFGGTAACTPMCTYDLGQCVDCIRAGSLCNTNQSLCCPGLECRGFLDLLPTCQTP